ACTSAGLTPGSCSNNSNWKFDNFSLPAPYFSIRRSRNCSSRTRTLNSATCSFCCSCSVSLWSCRMILSASERLEGPGTEELEVALTLNYEVAEVGCGKQSLCAVFMRLGTNFV